MANILNKLFFIIIYLYIIILAIVPSKYEFKSIPLNGDVILAIIIILYFMRILFSVDTRVRFVKGVKNFFTDYLTISLFMLSFIMVMSILYASDKKIAIYESFRFISYVMLFFIIKYELHDKYILDNIIKTYIFTCFLVFSIGIIINYNTITQIRLESTLENSNNLGAFAILSIFPLIILFIEEKGFIRKMFYFIISIAALVNIVLSGSRNSLIAFAIGCLILCFIYGYKFIIASLLIAAMAYKIPRIYNRILQISDSSQNDSRIQIWKVAFKMIKEHPLIGIGNGNFHNLFQQYIHRYPEISNSLGTTEIYHPHNIILKFQSELGIIGTMAFMGVFISIPIKLKKFISNTKSNFYKSFYKGFFVSFIVFMFMNMIDNFFSAPKVITFFWILIAVTQSLTYNCTEL